MLKRLTEDPERPYAVVLGGAKVADKLAVIDNLMGTADRLLIGGGMLFTFLAAQGHEIGTSLFDADSVEAVQGLPASGRRRPASRSCCRSTSSAAASSPPTPRPSRSRPTPSPPT